MPAARTTSASSPPSRSRSSFIVRLWFELRESDLQQIWRGSVTDTQTGQVLLFNTMAALVDFLARSSGLPLTDHPQE